MTCGGMKPINPVLKDLASRIFSEHQDATDSVSATIAGAPTANDVQILMECDCWVGTEVHCSSREQLQQRANEKATYSKIGWGVSYVAASLAVVDIIAMMRMKRM